MDQTIRLKEGEASIMGGLLQQSLTNNFSGIPGLSQIPLLKYLFSNNDKIQAQDEIVFLLIPHVVRGEDLSPLNLKEIDTGTGTSVSLRRIGSIRVPASAVEPASPAGKPSAELPPNQQQPAPAGTQPQGMQAAAQQAMEQAATANNAAPISVALAAPAAAPKVGSTFQVPVNVSGGSDVFSVPLQLQYDPTKLTLINVDSGNYLGHDGQTVALVHRDDGAGGVAISASRPPGRRRRERNGSALRPYIPGEGCRRQHRQRDEGRCPRQQAAGPPGHYLRDHRARAVARKPAIAR